MLHVAPQRSHRASLLGSIFPMRLDNRKAWHLERKPRAPPQTMMMIMMMMMMMINCFCGMIDLRKAFSLISSRDYCQRSSPSRISDSPGAGFEPAQNHVQNLSWMKLCSIDNHYTIIRFSVMKLSVSPR